MLKTRKAQYVVHAKRRTHIWLEVIEGEDEGIRISIPRHHPEYEDELERDINEVTAGDTLTATLVSENEESPNWRVDELFEHKVFDKGRSGGKL